VNPFTLGNSGDAVELAYVQANVSCGEGTTLIGPFKTTVNAQEFKMPDDCAAVLVKANGPPDDYYLYVNVTTGTVLKTHNGNNISHISCFECICEEDPV
jgi:hypothetical protein